MSTTKITVIKRDGAKVEFNKEKIANAIFKAAQSVGGVNKEIADNLADKIEENIKKNAINITEIEKTVEEIQDLVEQMLIENNYDKTAKSYILYRNQRTRTREVGSYIAKTIRNISFSDSIDSDTKRENGNINTDTMSGNILKIGSETSKWFVLNEILRPEHAAHHIDGTYHIHDMDFFLSAFNCCQLPLDKLLENGFSTGHGYARSPSNIMSAAALTCIAIQSNQCDMFGGQSIPTFDFALAPYVKKTYIKQLLSVFEVGYPAIPVEALKRELNLISSKHQSLLNENDLIFNVIMDVIQKEDVKVTYTEGDYKQRIYEMINLAIQRTDKETYQAMEALIHNLNMLNSRSGGQVPFSSINFGMDTSAEGRMVSKNLMLAQEAGMGNGETSIFPITIFTVKGGYNYYPEDPNYDLFKLACKVSAKRLFPNFNSIHNNFNTPYYKEGHPETQVAVMGSLYTEDKYITVRFNNNDDEIYKFNFNWFIENIEKEFNKYICEQDWIPAVNLKNSYYHNLQNVEVFDGSNAKFTKLKKVMYWNHEQFDTQWFVVYYAHPDKPREVQKLIATFDHPFPVQINNEIKRTRLIDIYKLIKENHEQPFLVGEANERINIVDIVNLDTTTMYRFTTTNIVFSDTEGTLSEETGDIKTYVRESSQEVKVYDLDNVLDYHESSKTKWNNAIRLTAKDLFMKLSDSVFDFTETNGGHIASYELLSKIEAGGTEFLTRSYDIETDSDTFALYNNLDSNQYVISHNCISEDSKIVLKNPDGKILYTTAGFFNNLGEGVHYLKDWKILSGGEFTDLINVAIRYENDSINEIRAAHGLIKVTDEHIVPIVRKRAYIEIPAKDIQIDDCLVNIDSREVLDEQRLTEINLIDKLPGTDKIVILYPEVYESKILELLNTGKIHYWDEAKHNNLKFYSTLAEYKAIREGLLKLRWFDENELFIQYKLSKTYIPAILKLTREFGRYLGLVYSEGCVIDYATVVTNSDENITNFVMDFTSSLGLDSHISYNKNNTGIVTIGNRLFTELFRNNILGYHFGSGNLRLPMWYYSANDEFLKGFLGGVIDGDGSVVPQNYTRIITASSTFAEDLQYLIKRLGFNACISIDYLAGTETTFGDTKSIRKHDNYRVTIDNRDIVELDLYDAIKPRKLTDYSLSPRSRDKKYNNRVYSIKKMPYDGFVYDFETGNHHFDSNTQTLHNCRTRVIGNVWDSNNEITPGRGNLSFTTINLPKLAILANKNIDKFFESLDEVMEEICVQLLDRYKIQSKRKAKNFPFLIQQGVWMDGKKLQPDDELGDLIRHGTLTVGFCGLSEALVALIGKHHGESEEAQELGLRIVKFMRDKMDQKADETKYNFSLIASPAESSAGRFARINRKQFGLIEGVTDKDYCTNSFHVTPGYECTSSHKIDIEAPYHKYCNAGGLSYCAC